MKQKYTIMKNDEKTGIIIREFAELDKEIFSFLCEETFDDKTVKSAIEKGQDTLIQTLRTQNLFPLAGGWTGLISSLRKTFYIETESRNVSQQNIKCLFPHHSVGYISTQHVSFSRSSCCFKCKFQPDGRFVVCER